MIEVVRTGGGLTPEQVVCAAYLTASTDELFEVVPPGPQSSGHVVLPSARIEAFALDEAHRDLAKRLAMSPLLDLLAAATDEECCALINVHVAAFYRVADELNRRAHVRALLQNNAYKSVVPVAITGRLPEVHRAGYVGTVAHYDRPVACTVFKPVAKYKPAFSGRGKVVHPGRIEFDEIDRAVTAAVRQWRYWWWWPWDY